MVLCRDERSFSQLAFKRNTGHRIKKKKKKIKSRIWNEFTKQFAQRNEYISEKNQRHVFFFDLATKDFYVLFMLLLLKKLGKFEPDDYLTDKISCWRNTEANDKFHD